MLLVFPLFNFAVAAAVERKAWRVNRKSMVVVKIRSVRVVEDFDLIELFRTKQRYGSLWQ